MSAASTVNDDSAFTMPATNSKHEPDTPNDLHADVATLSSLIPELLSASEDADVTELLGSLDSANGLAAGVESRLDNLLGDLDSLLVALQAKGDTTTGVSHPPQSEENLRSGSGNEPNGGN